MTRKEFFKPSINTLNTAWESLQIAILNSLNKRGGLMKTKKSDLTPFIIDGQNGYHSLKECYKMPNETRFGFEISKKIILWKTVGDAKKEDKELNWN